MSNVALAARNVWLKVGRRLKAVPKPLVRRARRRARAREGARMLAAVAAADAEVARAVRGAGPIIAGPWLAEVGYEALYWVPFLRWVVEHHGVAPERLIVLSRGGTEPWYRGLAGRYVELFDCLPPDELAARNDARQQAEEGGGRKQSVAGALDDELLAFGRRAAGAPEAAVLHPSLLFRAFRDVWQGNLAPDLFWARTRYARITSPPRPDLPGLPSRYVAVKCYGGVTLPPTPAHRELLGRVIADLAARVPVVTLDTGLAVDDHEDFSFAGLANVTSARDWMTARTNLGVQTALVAHAECFVGTCGGLAWLAPFLGTPTVAAYADDRLLGPHLLAMRQAGRQAGAAEFMPLDLRAVARLAGQWPERALE